LVAHCRKCSLFTSSLSTRMELSGTEQDALPSSFASSTLRVQATAELTAVMRSPIAASKTAVNVLLPASGSTANAVPARAGGDPPRASARESAARAVRIVVRCPGPVPGFIPSRGAPDARRGRCGRHDLALLVVAAHQPPQLEGGEDRERGHHAAAEHQPGSDLEWRGHSDPSFACGIQGDSMTAEVRSFRDPAAA